MMSARVAAGTASRARARAATPALPGCMNIMRNSLVITSAPVGGDLGRAPGAGTGAFRGRELIRRPGGRIEESRQDGAGRSGRANMENRPYLAIEPISES